MITSRADARCALRSLIRTVPLLLVLAACGGEDVQAQIAAIEAAVPDPSARRVEVAEVRPTDAILTLELPGEVEGAEDALLASPAGGRVEEVRVREGAEVRRGEVLIALDRDLHEAQLAQAEANLALARDQLARTERLGEFSAASELEVLRTQVLVAEAGAKLARAQLDRAVVRAPFDGTVGTLDADVGEMAAPGAPLVRLVKLDPVVVSLSVSDRDVVALVPDTPARVRTAATAAVLDGRVVRVAPVGDLQTRSFAVDVEVANPERRLLPGMIARVEVDRTLRREAVVLPQEVVVTRLDDYGVFVADGTVARWRELVLADVLGGQVVVEEGLAAGDRVVVGGQRELVDGDTLLVDREGWCCLGGRPVFDDTTAARVP